MALGGGKFTTQNKTLPGSYINFVSAKNASPTLSERGTAAIGMEFSWGVDDQIFSVTSEEFLKDSFKIFGYNYTAQELKNIREIFKNASKCLLYKLNTGGVNAENTYATAKHKGTRGNSLKTVIVPNESSTQESPLYDVKTYLGTVLADEQKGVSSLSALEDNDYVVFKDNAAIALTAGLPLSGGTNGTASNASHQMFLDALESYSYNTLGCAATDSTLKALYANYTKRMRDDVGVKMQCVLHQYTTADHEGVISVENTLVGGATDTSLVYWVLGAEAGCAVNKSNTNKKYDGEYDVNADYTQTQLEAAINAGKFILHRVNNDIRVLEDVNTLVTATEEKGDDFKSNQTVRVLDQIGNDIASIFNTQYLGAFQNTAANRGALWNNIVSHHLQLQTLGAIEEFDTDDVVISEGDTKRAVVVEDAVTVVNAMSKLYMSVIVQ
jgi:hypothetical protein